MNRTVYVVQTQAINLGEVPLSDGDEFKPAFRPLFASQCFVKLRNSILDQSRVEAPEDIPADEEDDSTGSWGPAPQKLIPLPGAPFIPRLGMICFNTRSAIFSNTGTRALLASEISRHEDFWDPKSRKLGYHYDHLDVFGYDSELEDQRMNMLYFELYKPIFMTACCGGKKMATGRLFLHFYPSGYLVLQLAFKLITCSTTTQSELMKGIYETQPWRKPTHWQWSSRIAQGNLQNIIEDVLKLIFDSIYASQPSRKMHRSNWYTSIKLFPGWDLQKLATAFFVYNVKSIEIRPARWSFAEDEFNENGNMDSSAACLIVSKEGLIRCLPEDYSNSRKRSLGKFWKSLTIAEYTLLTDKIFSDYSVYLQAEIHRMRDFRLSLKRKMMKDDLLKFTAYRSELPRYLAALHNHVHSANSYYRFVHSRIADGLGLYERYQKLDGLVKEWTSEVEQWEPSLSVLWSKVIGPIRSLMGLLK